MICKRFSCLLSRIDLQEQVIELEYVLALDSETQDSLPHKDWVSALDKRQDLPSRNFLFSGSYDNNVSLWVLSGKLFSVMI